MEFIDTHCHIHSVDYSLPIEEVDTRANEVGVSGLICVGTDAVDSARAVQFVADRPNSWASVGQHPHEASYGLEPLKKLRSLVELDRQPRKVIAIGECGLDYFYNHSSKRDQEMALRYQIELGLECNLPLIFHVREAFADFWPIFDSYQGIRGVIHSFTDTGEQLSKALSRGLFIGANGIMTFTKNDRQLEAARQIPLDHLLLETDAPFLTPVPMRGKVNEPACVRLVAQFLSQLRQIPLSELAARTTTNARHIFSI